MNFILIYITHPNLETAQKVVTSLIESRLVACSNFFPIQSMYWWNGKIENTEETVSIVKTKKENWEKVKAEVIKIHPYETPYVIKIEVEGNEDYVDWINEEVR